MLSMRAEHICKAFGILLRGTSTSASLFFGCMYLYHNGLVVSFFLKKYLVYRPMFCFFCFLDCSSLNQWEGAFSVGSWVGSVRSVMGGFLLNSSLLSGSARTCPSCICSSLILHRSRLLESARYPRNAASFC